MSEIRRERLWEYTWRERDACYPSDDDIVRTFRIVGWYYRDTDDQDHPVGEEKLQALIAEELHTNAMGDLAWQYVEHGRGVPAEALGRLLQLAGLIPSDADLSSL